MIPATKPPNFSWVVDNVLAACALPCQPAHYQYLKNQGVRHVFNLTEWKTPPNLLPSGVNAVHLPVEEFGPPSIEQMHQFTSFVEESKQKNEAVAVHCYWGLGRTGTMLAAYLVRYQGVGAWNAIARIRHMRPYSIETEDQEDAVVRYAAYVDYLKKEGQPDASCENGLGPGPSDQTDTH